MKNQSKQELKVIIYQHNHLNYIVNLVTLLEWVKDYESQFVDSKSLQTAVDVFMRGFDKAKEKEEKKLKAKEGVADDEGWITVTRE